MNKVIIVTGASRGIGKAVAAALSAAGHTIIGTSRTAPDLERLDVTDPDSARRLVNAVHAEHGRIDAVVNNAGRAMLGPQEGFGSEQIANAFAVNVSGPMNVNRAVLPIMRAAGSGQLIHISSVVGWLPAPFMGVYAATKHALEGYATSLDEELRGTGVRSLIVRPGFMRTPIAEGTVHGEPMDGYGDRPARVATAIAKALQTADDPAVVGRHVARLIAMVRPPAISAAGREAKMLEQMARLFPRAALLGGMRRQMGLGGS